MKMFFPPLVFYLLMNYIYHPVKTAKRTQAKSCGLIFYDVNGVKAPNRLGLDQYIISIGSNGIR